MSIGGHAHSLERMSGMDGILVPPHCHSLAILPEPVIGMRFSKENTFGISKQKICSPVTQQKGDTRVFLKTYGLVAPGITKAFGHFLAFRCLQFCQSLPLWTEVVYAECLLETDNFFPAIMVQLYPRTRLGKSGFFCL